jgi:hypothetical protein
MCNECVCYCDAKKIRRPFYETEYLAGAIDDAPTVQASTGAVLPRASCARTCERAENRLLGGVWCVLVL